MCEGEHDLSDEDWMLISIFVGEIQERVNALLFHFELLNDALRKNQLDAIFYLIHSILMGSAQLSLIFYPSRKSFRWRGELLVRGFEIQGAIDLLKDRKIRDHIAHKDERIHAWHSESSHRNIIRKAIGAVVVEGDAVSNRDIIEHYDPATTQFVFRGDHYNLMALNKAMLLIRDRVSEIGKHPWWEDSFKKIFLRDKV